MAVQYRAYLLGPPVRSGDSIAYFFEEFLSRWIVKIRNFEVISVAGLVVYKQDWVKPTTAASAIRRASMRGCDLWSLEFRSSDLNLDTGLSVIVQD